MTTSYLQQTFDLTNRTALVTGSARGIGLAIATALGRAGARVVINDLSLHACTNAVNQLSAEGINVRYACFDVSDHQAVKQAHRQLSTDQWFVDVLVNNAGNQNRKPLVEMTSAEWQQLMDVHVNGAFHCLQTFLPDMCSRGFGRVVMMSSVAGQATMPNIAAYTTAKGAVAALTRAAAVEYAAYGITVNAIAPGFVRTDFTIELQHREGFEDFIRGSVPCGRWASTDDIAPAVIFLASAAASFINGHTLAIDGGMLARM